MASVVSVLLVAVGLFYTNAANREQQDLTRQGLMTERFTRAIDQIGSDKLDMRVGGIYTLERLMRDSPADQSNILDVLCTFVREHAPTPDPGVTSTPDTSPAGDFALSRHRPAADVQAALFAIGGRPADSETYSPDLSLTDLTGARLDGANLANAYLEGADLSGASLMEANLTGAYLPFADLREAFLGGADLSGAWVRYADFTDAVLTGAKLADVDLTPIYGLTSALIKCAELDDGTLLPVGMERPASEVHRGSQCRI